MSRLQNYLIISTFFKRQEILSSRQNIFVIFFLYPNKTLYYTAFYNKIIIVLMKMHRAHTTLYNGYKVLFTQDLL